MKTRLPRYALPVLAAWVASLPAAADYRTAVEAYQAGRLEEACAEFAELVRQSPSYDFGHFVAGQCAAAAGRHEEATRHLETAVELNPERADYRCQLAGELLRAGGYSDAVELLDPVEDRVDDGLAYSFHSTRGLAHAALQEWSKAARDLWEAERARPGQPAVLDRLALSLFGLRRYGEAAAIARRAAHADAGNAGARRLLAEALLHCASCGPRDEVYEEALSAAVGYRERRPDDSAADYLVGRAALGAGDHERAVGALGDFVSFHPDHCPARINLGLAYVGLRRWESAERELGAAALCAPRSADTLDSLALVYRVQGRLEEALATYERLQTLEPSPAVEEAIREVRYNLEARAINQAADEEEERRRLRQIEADRAYQIMQDKIRRYMLAVRDE